MNIYIYEPQGIQSGIGLNVGERVKYLQKVLEPYSPSEIRNILELRDDNQLLNLDIESNIFIAHYTDVKINFWEMKTFSKAICIFHTYDTDWNPDKIKINPVCNNINNNINRYCIDSNNMKKYIEPFVRQLLQTGKVDFGILEGFQPEE